MATPNYITTLYFQTLDHANQMLYTTMDLALKVLQNLPDRPSKEMEKLLRDGKGDVIVTDSFSQAEELKQRLEDRGVNPVKIINYRGKGFVYTPSDQREIAQPVVDGYFSEAERDVHVSVSQMSDYADGNVKEVVLPEDEASVLLSKCEDAGMPVSILQPEEGQCKILFAEKDGAKFEYARAQAAVDLTSERGAALREQAEWRNTYENGIRNAVINGKKPDGKPLTPGTTIVDMEGRTVTINRTTIELVDEKGEKSLVSRSSKELDRKMILFFDNMKDPALLSRNEMNDFSKMPAQERRDYIYQKQRDDTDFSNGRPVYSQEQLEEFARQEPERQQILDTVVEVPVQHEGDTVDHTEKVPAEQACREFGLLSNEESAYMSISSQPRDTFTIDDEVIEKVDTYLGDTEPEDAPDLLADRRLWEAQQKIFYADEEVIETDFGGEDRGMSWSDRQMEDWYQYGMDMNLNDM